MSTRTENVSVSVSENTKIEPCLSLGPCIENFVVEDFHNNSVPNGQSSAMDSTADTLNYNQVECDGFLENLKHYLDSMYDSATHYY